MNICQSWYSIVIPKFANSLSMVMAHLSWNILNRQIFTNSYGYVLQIVKSLFSIAWTVLYSGNPSLTN